MSMRKKVVAVLLTVAMATMSLTACGGAGAAETGATEESTEVVVEKNEDVVSAVSEEDFESIADEIIIAVQKEAVTLDPVLLAYTTDLQIVNMICETLVKTTDDGTDTMPGLAESWDISEDGLVYTFHLVPDLTFSDGTAVTAEDWEFSFERAMTTPESSWVFSTDNIASVEVVDDTTLVITLKELALNLLSNLSCFNVSLQSKAQYEATNGYTDAGSYPIGTGSYCMEEWVQDDHITLIANEYYYGEQPKTQTIKFLTVSDDNSRIMMLKAGEVDIITEVPYSNMEDINNTDGLIGVGISSTKNQYIIFNHTANDALGSTEVRQALLYATDKQLIVDMILYGYGSEAVSYMPQNGLYWNDEIVPVEYDTEKALELMAEAGYPDGFEIEVLIQSGNDTYAQIATILKDMWAKVGIDLTITTLDSAAVWDLESTLQHDMILSGWSDDLPDPSQLGAYWWDYSASQCYFTGYDNVEIQELFAASQIETDEAEREAMYYELQQIFYDEVVAINMFHADATVAMSDDIKGYVETPLYSYRFDQLVKTVE
ncbi:MAG: ABC transporter substrate-binding protein [Eubacteriales bacterium]